jgi:hypothetical protein
MRRAWTMVSVLVPLVCSVGLAWSSRPAPSVSSASARSSPSEIVFRFRVRGHGPHQDCVVRQTDVDPPVESRATVVRHRDSTEPTSIVFVAQVNQRSADRIQEIQETIDWFVAQNPAATRGAIVSYGNDAMVTTVPGPLDRLRYPRLPDWFLDDAESSLSEALEEALRILADKPGRRVAVVIGDGRDADGLAAMDHMAGRLAAIEAEVYTIRLDETKGSEPPADDYTVRRGLRGLEQLGSLEQETDETSLVDHARAVQEKLDAVHAVTIAPDAAPLDGEPHTYELVCRGARVSAEIEATFPPIDPPHVIICDHRPRTTAERWVEFGSQPPVVLTILFITALAFFAHKRWNRGQ